jgi:MFS family permease
LQPHLLDLWGDEAAYGIAGLAAALMAAAQIAGGLLTPRLRPLFRRRTGMILAMAAVGVLAVALIALVPSFWVVLALIVLWSLATSAATPVRQAYLNGMIPSRQRATLLSFDSLMSSTGGAIAQPGLGRAADAWGYPASFGISAAIAALALPFVWLSRRERHPADAQVSEAAPAAAG